MNTTAKESLSAKIQHGIFHLKDATLEMLLAGVTEPVEILDLLARLVIKDAHMRNWNDIVWPKKDMPVWAISRYRGHFDLWKIANEDDGLPVLEKTKRALELLKGLVEEYSQLITEHQAKEPTPVMVEIIAYCIRMIEEAGMRSVEEWQELCMHCSRCHNPAKQAFEEATRHWRPELAARGIMNLPQKWDNIRSEIARCLWRTATLGKDAPFSIMTMMSVLEEPIRFKHESVHFREGKGSTELGRNDLISACASATHKIAAFAGGVQCVMRGLTKDWKWFALKGLEHDLEARRIIRITFSAYTGHGEIYEWPLERKEHHFKAAAKQLADEVLEDVRRYCVHATGMPEIVIEANYDVSPPTEQKKMVERPIIFPALPA